MTDSEIERQRGKKTERNREEERKPAGRRQSQRQTMG